MLDDSLRDTITLYNLGDIKEFLSLIDIYDYDINLVEVLELKSLDPLFSDSKYSIVIGDNSISFDFISIIKSIEPMAFIKSNIAISINGIGLLLFNSLVLPYYFKFSRGKKIDTILDGE
jgi:hypothetical protein